MSKDKNNKKSDVKIENIDKSFVVFVIIISKIISIKIAVIPSKIGFAVSCKGIAAISDIKSGITSSLGCISPI